MKRKVNSNNKSMIFNIIVISVAIAAAVIVFYGPSKSIKEEDKKDITSSTESSEKVKKASMEAKTNDNGDIIIINASDITETATFYSYDKLGVNLEVLAVKAPDGTIRTAFNTCQVCYSSGKGYYVQKADKLVCQNCGNKFAMEDIQVTKGGCNPVPIMSEDKVVTDTTITIPKKTLSDAKIIFENWKV